jgi:hypothetical protein
MCVYIYIYIWYYIYICIYVYVRVCNLKSCILVMTASVYLCVADQVIPWEHRWSGRPSLAESFMFTKGVSKFIKNIISKFNF